MSIALDKLYTYIHYTGAPRNIPDYIMSLKEKDSLDFAIFGSSRVLHNINIDLIEKETNKKGFNFGVPGSSVFEIKLSVQQILKRKITKNIYIQIDYIWNELYGGGPPTVDWLTYINEEDIWNEFQKIDVHNEYSYYKKIPYLRYCKFGSKLGFRELTLSLLNRELKTIKVSKGFVPLYGHLNDSKKQITYELKDEFNSHLIDLIRICKNENVNLFFFTSPMLNFTGNNSILENTLPNYLDFSNSVSNAMYYSDNIHLNEEGSAYFTHIFINKYLKPHR